MKPANELGLDYDHSCDISNFPQKAKKCKHQKLPLQILEHYRWLRPNYYCFHPKSTYTRSNESHVDAIFSKVSSSNFLSIFRIQKKEPKILIFTYWRFYSSVCFTEKPTITVAGKWSEKSLAKF